MQNRRDGDNRQRVEFSIDDAKLHEKFSVARENLEVVRAKMRALEDGILECQRAALKAGSNDTLVRACRVQAQNLTLRRAELLTDLAKAKSEVIRCRELVVDAILHRTAEQAKDAKYTRAK